MKELSKHGEIALSILIILIISGFTFLPFINQLGFYGDDWIMLWGFMTSGSEKVASIYATDRPFTGHIVGLIFNVLGTEPINWQIFIFIMHLASTLLFFWLVRMLWGDQKIPTLMMALIYGTYPGFLQTPQALTYQALFIGINFGLLGMILGLHAIRMRNRFFAILLSFLSCGLFIVCLLMVEWLIGILAFYMILVFYEIKKFDYPIRSLIIRTIFYSLPALLSSSLFLIWRVYFFENKRMATDISQLFSNYGVQTLSKVFNLFIDTSRSFFKTAVLPWFVSFNDLWEWGTKSITLQALLVATAAFFIVGLIYFIHRKPNEKKDFSRTTEWSRDGIIIGFVGILFTLIPVTFTGRTISLLSTFNRYTLNSVTGVAILVISFLYYLIKHIKPIYFLISLLLFLSIFTHYVNTSRYKEDYQNQNDFWWQLSWRAPDIKDGTVFTPVGLGVQDYFHIFPQINLIYRPDSKNLAISTQILNNNTIKEILVSRNIKESSLRGISFQRDYQKLLIVSIKDKSCLHIWDGSNTALTAIHNPVISIVAHLSNVSTIDTKSINHFPPEIIFGEEPAHRWCYYYQKASLAQQDGDWETIINLGQELNSQKLHPLDVSEWMPFFEGYANSNQLEEAEGIALRMKSDMATVNLICKALPAEKPNWYNHLKSDTYEFMKQTLCN